MFLWQFSRHEVTIFIWNHLESFHREKVTWKICWRPYLTNSPAIAEEMESMKVLLANAKGVCRTANTGKSNIVANQPFFVVMFVTPDNLWIMFQFCITKPWEPTKRRSPTTATAPSWPWWPSVKTLPICFTPKRPTKPWASRSSFCSKWTLQRKTD